ncbi:MAG: DUF4440 domain-containing protein [Acidobacteriaceae bacterium]
MPADKPATNAEPSELEARFMQPQVRRDRAQVQWLLAEDFHAIGLAGRMADRAQVLDRLEHEPPATIEIVDVAQKTLAPGVALVTYREIRREDSAHPGLASLRSSLWVQRDGRWQMIFHQGTPIPSVSA